MSQRRNYFRIQFPMTQRPRLVVGSAEFEIVELAETGARVIAHDAALFDGADPFDATIQFRDDVSAAVTACVHRRENNEVVLRFSASLPYSIVAAQQRRLLKLFPRQAASPASAAGQKKP